MQNNDTTDSIVPVTHAAYAHVETVVAQADGNSGSSPWWHGWAVREAFEAGAAWQRSNGSTEAPLDRGAGSDHQTVPESQHIACGL